MEWQTAETFKPGDKFTIAGLNAMTPNPERRWWQFWKPRMVDSGAPAVFVCLKTFTAPLP